MRTTYKTTFLLFLLGVAVLAMAQDACCPDRVGSTSVEAWFLHNNLYVGVGHWLSAAANATLMIGPGSPFIFVGSMSTVVERTCFFNLFLSVMLSVPIPALDWQTLFLGSGLEFCIPSLPEFALKIGLGIYLNLPAWITGTYALLGAKFYF